MCKALLTVAYFKDKVKKPKKTSIKYNNLNKISCIDKVTK